ncbi:hypothetical protein [Methylobacterium iners]|uniref:hypothetical protein n=1 Tax=Methylobacterium iners TaxID=418707 RepID=UPI001EE2E1D2|nr:hypothetical protein [Methylobacterium iners]
MPQRITPPGNFCKSGKRYGHLSRCLLTPGTLFVRRQRERKFQFELSRGPSHRLINEAANCPIANLIREQKSNLHSADEFGQGFEMAPLELI